VGRAYGTHGSGEKSTGFSWESPREGDHSEDRGLDGRMGSEWILGIMAGEVGGGGGGMDSVGSGHEPVAGSCEHGDESSGSGATEFVN
jgi:hypothetical protein